MNGKLPKSLSPSSIDLYQQCPRRFYHEKVVGQYSPSGPEALLGTFVHAILEKLMEHPPEERTLEVAKLHAREVWPKTEGHGDFKRLRMSKQQRLEFRWSAWRSVETYFTMEDLRAVEVVATERKVKCEVAGIPMSGIVDRLDREGKDLIVADYKNGKVPDPKYRASKWRQLNYYANMIEVVEEERPTEGRLIFTAHGQILTTEFTDDSMEEARSVLTDTWDGMHADFESEAWEPKPQPLCGWCDAIEHCPEGLATARMSYKKGRLKKTAPAYNIVANL